MNDTQTETRPISKLSIHIVGKDLKQAKYHLEQCALCLKRAESYLAYELDNAGNESFEDIKHAKTQTSALFSYVMQTIDASNGIDEQELLDWGKEATALPELVSQALATKIFGLSRGRVQMWIVRGDIIPVEVCGERLVRVSDIERLLEDKS